MGDDRLILLPLADGVLPLNAARYLGIYWQEEIIPFFEKVTLSEGKTVRAPCQQNNLRLESRAGSSSALAPTDCR